MLKHTLLIVFLLPSLSRAASFDCGKASSAVEKTICADPVLSTLDSEVAASYSDAMKRLTPEGQAVLKDGQRQWLRFVRKLCVAPAAASGAGACLSERYRDRLKDLANAAVAIGPYLFSRSERFTAGELDETGQAHEVSVAAPRIDMPQSPAISRWNALLARQATHAASTGCEANRADTRVSYEVTYATAQAISVRTMNWQYCQGAAHGNGATAGISYIMQPKLRVLEASDLFKAGSAWQDYLTRRCTEAIEKKAEGEKFDPARIRQGATRVRNWALTPQGLSITFDPYEVLSYAAGTTEVTIDWRDLQPYLATGAPVPPGR